MESIALAGTVLSSEILYTEPDKSSWHPNLSGFKISFNVIILIPENILTSDF
jgi:hypothetical protein